MIRVCILGSIGSGKTFVSKLFNSPVFNADKEVNLLYKNNKNCYQKLKKILPKYIKSFPIARSELIKAVLNNKKNLRKISNIVHPLVRSRLKFFIKKNKKKKMIILDIPLLIENKLNRKNDILIFVVSKKEKILKRLKKRENYNKKMLANLRENQLILSKKKQLADYLIDNNFSHSKMKNKIKVLKEKILNERNNIRY
tara:strand:+ start:121 stop:714 length:594 start_codon:yes stop_codon:yes gene_type:complete